MISRKFNKDKRGFMGIVFFFLILFTILIIGFIGALAITVIDFGSETITPIMTDLGVVGATNLTEASEITFGTTNTIVNMMPWLLLFTYTAMLIFTIIFVISYRFNPHPAYIGVYFMFVVLLIMGSILISNMYQDLHQSTDSVIGDGLKSQTGMSYMIIHSPKILTIFAIIVGIFIFAGTQREGDFEI